MPEYECIFNWTGKYKEKKDTFEEMLEKVINIFIEKFGEKPDVIRCSEEDSDLTEFIFKDIPIFVINKLKKNELVLYKNPNILEENNG
jgi:hypothetical protein